MFGIKRMVGLFVALMAFAVTKAQEQTMVQLKALDHKLQPYPGLSISLNDRQASQLDDQGFRF